MRPGRVWRGIVRRIAERMAMGLEINLTTRAQIESLGHIAVPPSALIRQARAFHRGQVAFTGRLDIAPGDLDRLLAGSLVRELCPNFRPRQFQGLFLVRTSVMRAYLGGEAQQGNTYQSLLVDVSDRDCCTVYISTIQG